MTVQGGFYEWYLEGMAEGRADEESVRRTETEAELVAQIGDQEVANAKFDLVGFVIAYEGGELDEEEFVEGFQHLIDSGLAWTLQGHYGRTAAALIEAGLCHA